VNALKEGVGGKSGEAETSSVIPELQRHCYCLVSDDDFGVAC
jgi:hypothetical protein